LLNMDGLTTEIKKFANDCRETEESKARRNELRRRLKDIINTLNLDGNVVIVGSCGNGFGTKNSDLDLTIVFTSGYSYNHAAIGILFKIEKSLESEGSSYTNVQVVSNANVPIIRFNYVCEAEEIPCDISINRRNNIFNAVLLKAYAQVDDRLQPLVLALKTWAKARRVVDSKNNRLASFALSLMAIHYLQSGCYPKVLPSLQQTHSTFFNTSDSNVDVISCYINEPLPQRILSFKSTNTQTIGELFVGFFDHYCSFNWGRDGISVREGRNIKRPLKRGRNNTCLFVEDPYEIYSNTVAGVFKEWIWSDIVREFKSAKEKLQSGKSFNNIH